MGELVIFLLIFILCGIVSAVIATNKGRSSGWFFVGFIFGPLGVLVALVISKDTEALDRQGIETGENRKCPFCAEIIKSEAKICKHCGKELPTIPKTNGTIFPATASGLLRAISKGNADAVLSILELDPSLLGSSIEDGQTPLHLAACYNKPQICAKLLELGADRSVKDNMQQTPLGYAKLSRFSEVVALLEGD